MKKVLIATLLAVALTVVPATGLSAATSSVITINATPAYIAITNSPTDWTVHGITGSSVINTSTTYFTNPNGDTVAPTATVADADCRFTVTNTSTVAIDLTVNFANFTGGDAMTNSNDGTAGATTFGAFAWASGANYATGKVVAKASGSSAMKVNLAAATGVKWGLTLLTQTNAWTSGTAMSSSATLTAAAH